jgi:hypothetical protein
MSRCGFCKRQFQNDQGVKGHLRWCRSYLQKRGEQSAISGGLSSQFASPGSADVNNTTIQANPFADLAKQFSQRFAGPDASTQLRQKRDAVLADLFSRLVDWDYSADGTITQEMAVAAKVAILDETSALPIEDMSPTELTLRGTSIRNRVFGPYLERQLEQRKREREVQEEEARRTQQLAAVQRRQATRKAALIELGVTRTLKSATAQGLTGKALVLLEWEVRARLDLLVVGDETEHQVDETMEAAIERPLFELASKKEQAEYAPRERLLNKCLSVALPLVEATLPWLEAVVAEKVSEKFGLHPSADSTYTESPTSSSDSQEAKPTKPADEATPRPIRRRKRTPEPPIEMPDHPPTRDGSDTASAELQRATG